MYKTPTIELNGQKYLVRHMSRETLAGILKHGLETDEIAVVNKRTGLRSYVRVNMIRDLGRII